MKKRIHLRISGRVQGVFFRSESRTLANSLGLTGWVRNTGDGCVEILAQGEEEKLQKFIDWCRRGPSHARVDHVEIKWSEPREVYSDFTIAY